MKKYLLLLLCLFSGMIYAQGNQTENAYVDGVVMDKATKEAIYSAAVSLTNINDSTIRKGALTDSIGYFRITAPKGNYKLKITYVGHEIYASEIALTIPNQKLSLDSILVEDKSIHLGEAVVVAETPSIVNKGDTIEYNANSFTPEQNAVLRDLVNEIPGLEVDEKGNIKANGEPVTKILVDGKEFFGNDIPLALANLPANMIKKLQLFKEDSKTAKVTGFKEKDKEQTLNLVVKDELKQSLFGNIKAGYGSSGRYSTRLVGNFMRGETQASLIGNLGNVSEYSGMSFGESRDKNLGGNAYVVPKKGMKVGFNARLNDSYDESETTSNTQTYLDTGDRLSKRKSKNIGKNQNFNFGFNMSWDIDSLTYLHARSSVQLGKNDSYNLSSNISYVENKLDTTTSTYDSNTKTDNYGINNTLTFGRRFTKAGRAVTLTLKQNIRNSDGKGINNSMTDYTDSIPTILDQRLRTKNKTTSYGVNISYIEPLGKDNRLRLSYSIDNSKMNNDRKTWKPNELGDYALLDSAYTRETDSKNTNQSIALEFQRTREKYDLTIGMSVDPSKSKSTIWLLDSIIGTPIKQNVVNYSPDIRFSYRPNSNTTYELSYDGRTRQPGVSELAADTTIVNPSYKYYGNPNLKPSYSNNLGLSYQKSDYESGRFLMLSGGFNFTLNEIASYTMIDKRGNTEDTYRNVNGNMGANIFSMYNTPFRNKKFTFSNYANISYNRNVGFTNGKKAKTNSMYFSESVGLSYKDKILTSRLNLSYNYNLAKNNLSKESNRSMSVYLVSHNATIKLPYDFSIRNDIKFNYYGGYGKDFKKSEIVWNAYIEKSFLKEKKATVRLQAFDILNDRNSLRRVTTSSYTSDTYTRSINRYVMLSFTYRFTKFGGGGKDQPMNHYHMMY